jgi:hypothetical protein
MHSAVGGASEQKCSTRSLGGCRVGRIERGICVDLGARKTRKI